MQNFHESVIAQAIDYIVGNYNNSPSLEELAAKFGYEPTHFQKIFKEKVGISPKRLIQFMNYSHARDFLFDGRGTLDAAYEAGLSGSGRLHDLFVTFEGATPGMVQKRGRGMSIYYGYHPSPLGELLIAVTARGICWLGFQVNESRAPAFDRMARHWPEADYIESADRTKEAAGHILGIWRGGRPSAKVKLDLHGTNFQIQVWRALLKIPSGWVVSYQDIANSLGVPQACRAVGTAVGANPVSLLIPCHRVIQKSGIVENYGWGTARKKCLLGLEAYKTDENRYELFEI